MTARTVHPQGDVWRRGGVRASGPLCAGEEPIREAEPSGLSRRQSGPEARAPSARHVRAWPVTSSCLGWKPALRIAIPQNRRSPRRFSQWVGAPVGNRLGATGRSKPVANRRFTLVAAPPRYVMDQLRPRCLEMRPGRAPARLRPCAGSATQLSMCAGEPGCGAARDGSPRRQQWGRGENNQGPARGDRSAHTRFSFATTRLGPPSDETHGSRRGLTSCAASQLLSLGQKLICALAPGSAGS